MFETESSDPASTPDDQRCFADADRAGTGWSDATTPFQSFLALGLALKQPLATPLRG